VVGVVARRNPTDDDRHKAIEIALAGLSHGDDLGDVAARLAPLHPRDNTFPGEVLLDLAAYAIGVAGASRQSPIEFEGIRERYLPDGIARRNARHNKSKFALRAAAMLHGGVDPGLLDEVQWWRTDDLWYWSLEALVAYVRCRRRTHRPVGGVHLPSDRRREGNHPRRRRHSVTATGTDAAITPDRSCPDAPRRGDAVMHPL
jgi:hypothetical protein